jgi:hypothetical protein
MKGMHVILLKNKKKACVYLPMKNYGNKFVDFNPLVWPGHPRLSKKKKKKKKKPISPQIRKKQINVNILVMVEIIIQA